MPILGATNKKKIKIIKKILPWRFMHFLENRDLSSIVSKCWLQKEEANKMKQSKIHCTKGQISRKKSKQSLKKMHTSIKSLPLHFKHATKFESSKYYTNVFSHSFGPLCSLELRDRTWELVKINLRFFCSSV